MLLTVRLPSKLSSYRYKHRQYKCAERVIRTYRQSIVTSTFPPSNRTIDLTVPLRIPSAVHQASENIRCRPRGCRFAAAAAVSVKDCCATSRNDGACHGFVYQYYLVRSTQVSSHSTGLSKDLKRVKTNTDLIRNGTRTVSSTFNPPHTQAYCSTAAGPRVPLLHFHAVAFAIELILQLLQLQ
jgi:hypothetical protein